MWAARACALLYSFQGETLTGDDAELPVLAQIADQTPLALFRNVQELLRRDLVQSRGVWRAVLPHAIANRLAVRALEDTPFDLIEKCLITDGKSRLALSFSRRLSYLHECERAKELVGRWLEPAGLLGDLASLDFLGGQMFRNISSVLPERALEALERMAADASTNSQRSEETLLEYCDLLRSLAYGADLFERSATLLFRAYSQGKKSEVKGLLAPLFKLRLSGTHAPVGIRLKVLDSLARLDDDHMSALGIELIGGALEAGNFISFSNFEFGARSRDFGYSPNARDEVADWYRSVLRAVYGLVCDGVRLPLLREIISNRTFRTLWSMELVCDELAELMLSLFSESARHQGWHACCECIYFDREQISMGALKKLQSLEVAFRPESLADRLRGMIFYSCHGMSEVLSGEAGSDIGEDDEAHEAVVLQLADESLKTPSVLWELSDDIFHGRSRWVYVFGRALACSAAEPESIWEVMIAIKRQAKSEQYDLMILRGFISGLWMSNREAAQEILDAAMHDPILFVHLPALQAAAGLDERGLSRIIKSARSGVVPANQYNCLAYVSWADDASREGLATLLPLICQLPDGLEVALEILSMQFRSNVRTQLPFDQGLISVGREVLGSVDFSVPISSLHCLEGLIDVLMRGQEGRRYTLEMTSKLCQSLSAGGICISSTMGILDRLFSVQPDAVLDAIFSAGESHDRSVSLINRLSLYGIMIPAEVEPDVLVGWCSSGHGQRYVMVASLIGFSELNAGQGSLMWSDHALAILTSAPDPVAVLKCLVRRFKPTSWSGSRAAIIEQNARLLDDLDGLLFSEYVSEAKKELAQDVLQERDRESRRDRQTDERFE